MWGKTYRIALNMVTAVNNTEFIICEEHAK